MREPDKRAALARVASKIAELNVEREQHFRDTAMGEIRLAQDAFRADSGSELPGPGDDRLLDALMELTRSLDGAPELVAAACYRALDAAGVLPSESAAEH